MTDVAILGRVLRNHIVPAQPTIGGGGGSGGGTGTAPGPSGIEFVIDGGGEVIGTGVAGSLVMPFDCTITAVELLADQTGSIVVDIWKSDYAGYPPSSGASITSTAKPTITSDLKSEDTALLGWTKTLTAGDILVFNVDSATSMQRCSVALTYTRPVEVSALEYVIDGGGVEPVVGVVGTMVVPFNCIINSVELLADQSGSIEVDIWKSDYSGYEPSSSGSIAASALPTITAAQKSQDTTLTGWTTHLSVGDILVYNVNSVSTITRCSVVLTVTRIIGAINALPKPAVRVNATANQDLASGSYVAIEMDHTQYDQGAPLPHHSDITLNSRLSCQIEGIYTISGGALLWAAVDAADFAYPYTLRIRLNGTTYLDADSKPAPIHVEQNLVLIVSTTCLLTPGDYVELVAYQSSGSTQHTSAGGLPTYQDAVHFEMALI